MDLQIFYEYNNEYFLSYFFFIGYDYMNLNIIYEQSNLKPFWNIILFEDFESEVFIPGMITEVLSVKNN